MSIAETNKNPGNVKQLAVSEWDGSHGSDAQGHAIFDDVPHGCRCLIKNLEAKYNSGKLTLLAIISSWAPADDTQGSIPGKSANDPGTYASTVAQWTGYDIYQDLRLFMPDRKIRSYDRLLQVCRGIERYEEGKAWVFETDWLEGLRLYTRDFVLKEQQMAKVA